MPFPDEPCDACPRRARGLPPPCRAMVRRHARYCDLARAGDTRHDAFLCRPEPGPMPSLPARAASLARAAAGFVASGLEVTTPEERARRLAICAACPEHDGASCRLCGCRLGIKVAMAAEHCPIGRW